MDCTNLSPSFRIHPPLNNIYNANVYAIDGATLWLGWAKANPTLFKNTNTIDMFLCILQTKFQPAHQNKIYRHTAHSNTLENWSLA